MRDLTISGLTAHQVELLNIIWSFDELDEMEAWKCKLSPRNQRMVDQLIRMVLLDAFDAEFEKETEFPEATAALKRIMKESRDGT